MGLAFRGDVLLILEPPRELITRDELVDAVWRPEKTEFEVDPAEAMLYCESQVAVGPVGPGSVGNLSLRL